MVTYVAIGLLAILASIKAFHYYYQIKRAPSQKQLSKLVLSTLRRGQSDRE
ncbi:hypothetical protein [Paenibacillus pinisoli]|uniref:hypothetical protein n=1 Tax=Paenibacillus pinisoli TaxID=1276110 RepID=UPI001402DE65|nr:hypothetical protein [Paenibacillus pinisoli]